MSTLSNHHVHDQGVLRLICPLHGFSGIGRAWLSAASAGSDNVPGAHPKPISFEVEWWAQTEVRNPDNDPDKGPDGTGIGIDDSPAGKSHGKLDGSYFDGHSDRHWHEMPAETHQINIVYNFTGADHGGVICLETAP